MAKNQRCHVQISGKKKVFIIFDFGDFGIYLKRTKSKVHPRVFLDKNYKDPNESREKNDYIDYFMTTICKNVKEDSFEEVIISSVAFKNIRLACNACLDAESVKIEYLRVWRLLRNEFLDYIKKYGFES